MVSRRCPPTLSSFHVGTARPLRSPPGRGCSGARPAGAQAHQSSLETALPEALCLVSSHLGAAAGVGRHGVEPGGSGELPEPTRVWVHPWLLGSMPSGPGARGWGAWTLSLDPLRPRRAAVSSQLSSACAFFILLSWLPTFFKETFPSSKVGRLPWRLWGMGDMVLLLAPLGLSAL